MCGHSYAACWVLWVSSGKARTQMNSAQRGQPARRRCQSELIGVQIDQGSSQALGSCDPLLSSVLDGRVSVHNAGGVRRWNHRINTWLYSQSLWRYLLTYYVTALITVFGVFWLCDLTNSALRWAPSTHSPSPWFFPTFAAWMTVVSLIPDEDGDADWAPATKLRTARGFRRARTRCGPSRDIAPSARRLEVSSR